MGNETSSRGGLVYTLAAFTWWGLVPIYFKLLGHVSPWEITCHRVIWSLLFTALWIFAARDWPAVVKSLKNPRTRWALTGSGLILGTNWFLFIYAVLIGDVLAASLGYYITPIFNVLTGTIVLGERMTKLQTGAVVLAGAGTLNMALIYGKPPWLALGMALSFSLYGLLRKKADIGPVGGLFVENAVLLPIAASWLGWLAFQGRDAFTSNLPTALLLMGLGLTTSLPLISFAAGVRRLRLIVVGLCQYTAPCIYFLLGVFLYHEPFTTGKLITFVFIWAGVAVFVGDSVVQHQRQHQRQHQQMARGRVK